MGARTPQRGEWRYGERLLPALHEMVTPVPGLSTRPTPVAAKAMNSR